MSILCIQAHGSTESTTASTYDTFLCDTHEQLISTTVAQYIFTDNLNDDKHIVVIDAGHGGHDPGTHGKHSKEKDIALSIALKFGKELNLKRPDIKVIYTREKDEFLPLHKRINIANRNKADLFISIHCNYAGNPHVCGSETFVMGLHRADDNLAVAKRENNVVLMENDFEKSYEGYDPHSPIGHILLSMYQNAFLSQSIKLASSIEDNLKTRTGDFNSRGVKQAGFLVLREATMPSVLIETGFLSNPKEEKYLMSAVGQSEMAKKLTRSVDEYLLFIKHEDNTPVQQVVTHKTESTIEHKPTKAKNTTKPTPATVKVDDNKTIHSKPKTPVKNEVVMQPQVKQSKKAHQPVSTKSLYTIQVGVYSSQKKSIFDFYSDKIGEVIEVKVDNLYKYMVGKFSEESDAKTACKEIKRMGIKDAYVVKL